MVLPIIRRAILDLLTDVGGEHNHEVIALMLDQLGHRVARRDVAEQLKWLAGERLVEIEEMQPYLVARVLPDGRDVSAGRLTIAGVSKHSTRD